MARIRTIKPEFWTSDQVVECSFAARLLFIGMWNFCDDYGVHPASLRKLKMEIFPGDDEMVTDRIRIILLLKDCSLATLGYLHGNLMVNDYVVFPFES